MQVQPQNTAIEALQRLVQTGRVPHALLLLGKTGSGSLAAGLWLARLLQCEQLGQSDTIQPCEQCNSCHKTGQMIHADVHFSYPTVGTNAVSTHFVKEWRSAIAENPYMDVQQWLTRIGADNKQGNINRDECNAILKKLSLRAFEGRYKILLMWLPEYLGKEGNRLLKLIEEPPEQTQFILVAEQADAILPTILSRCQLVKTGTLTDEQVAEGLQQLRQMPTERAAQIAFLADGDLNVALELADNADSDDSVMLLEWLRHCWRGHGPELVAWTDKFAKLGRENQKQFLQYGLHFLREMTLLMATGNGQLRLRPDELATATNMAKVLTLEKIAQIIEIFNDNTGYIERNANPKILFLDTSIRLHQLMRRSFS
jgi:DNA polymerase III subunit delta'